jgi:hypothetical protein
MCLPISVLTQGRVSGCNGSCNLWPHIGALAVLLAGMAWNFRKGIGKSVSGKKRSEIDA